MINIQKVSIALILICSGIKIKSQDAIDSLKAKLNQEWQILQQIKKSHSPSFLILEYQKTVVAALEDALKERLALDRPTLPSPK